MKSENETNNINVIFNYKKKHNPEELEGSVKECPACHTKQYRCGRRFTPCICKFMQPYPKKIRPA